MRKKHVVANQDWGFDGTVHIPVTWKRRGGRKVIIAPDGGYAWAPAKPRGRSSDNAFSRGAGILGSESRRASN